MIASESVSYDHIFKIILVGDNGVGKSSIIRRFCEGTYASDMDTTIGVDFYLSEIDVNGKKIKVKIWDTAGSEKYMSISAVYYRKADGVIFVFDMTRPRSFTNVVSVWMNAVEAQESGCPEAIKLLVGNKADLDSEVDMTQVRRYAELHDMHLLEASARSNTNIKEIFTKLAKNIIDQKESKDGLGGGEGGGRKHDSLYLNRGQNQKKSKGRRGGEGEDGDEGGGCKC